jgi:hypothetical protein
MITLLRSGSHSKAAGGAQPAALPSSPYAAFLGGSSWVSNRREAAVCPHRDFPSAKGTANPTSQSYGRVTAFLRPRFRISRFRCGKRKAPTPLPVVEAKVARFCFLPMPLGTGTAKARALTTPSLDAENVTHSRKICDAQSSPRFPLFYIATL